MQVVRDGEQMSASLPSPSTIFVGSSSQRILNEPDQPVKTAVIFVRFETGAHTHWHAHSGGQFLYVIEGGGLIQVQGEEVVSLGQGDAVIADPRERHWHGASSTGPAVYIACCLGDEDWGEAPAL